MVSSIAIYCLHTVKWFQVLLSVEVLLYVILEHGSCVELCIKVNTHLGMRKGRLYVHQDVLRCAGHLVHSLGSDWLLAQEYLY